MTATNVNNQLIIDEENVTLSTNVDFVFVDIRFRSDFKINSLLPRDWFIRKAKNRIIILKLKSTQSTDVLFKYIGKCSISRCDIYDKESIKHQAIVNYISIVKWSKLMTNKTSTGTTLTGYWGNLTTKYEDLIFNGNNSIYRMMIDKKKFMRNGNTTDISQKVLSKAYTPRYDLNINVVENQQTYGGRYFLVDGTPYDGKYHYFVKEVPTATDSLEEYVITDAGGGNCDSYSLYRLTLEIDDLIEEYENGERI